MGAEKAKDAKSLEKELDRRRKTNDFLPEYSDFYFETKQQRKTSRVIISTHNLILFSIMALIMLFKKTIVNAIAISSLVFVFYYCRVHPPIMNKKKLCGTTFYKDSAEKKDFSGNKTSIAYSEIEQEILAGNMRYGHTGMQIGKGRNRLTFHYEIGDVKAQQHVEQCYNVLKSRLNTPLLPYDSKIRDLMDRKYFYKKSRRNQTISLVAALLTFLFFSVNEFSNMGFAIIASIILCFWECTTFKLLFRNAKLNCKNHDNLTRILSKDHPNAKYGYKYAGYLCFAVDTVLTLLGNLLIILLV